MFRRKTFSFVTKDVISASNLDMSSHSPKLELVLLTAVYKKISIGLTELFFQF